MSLQVVRKLRIKLGRQVALQAINAVGGNQDAFPIAIFDHIPDDIADRGGLAHTALQAHHGDQVHAKPQRILDPPDDFSTFTRNLIHQCPNTHFILDLPDPGYLPQLPGIFPQPHGVPFAQFLDHLIRGVMHRIPGGEAAFGKRIQQPPQAQCIHQLILRHRYPSCVHQIDPHAINAENSHSEPQPYAITGIDAPEALCRKFLQICRKTLPAAHDLRCAIDFDISISAEFTVAQTYRLPDSLPAAWGGSFFEGRYFSRRTRVGAMVR